MYSKTNFTKGNFVKYNNQLHLIFQIENTIVGSILNIISCDNNKNIYRILESKVQPYTRKPNGKISASQLTKNQQNCIKLIENILNVQFNGKTMTDVSTFISYFIDASRSKKYTDEKIELAKYDGLDWTDFA